MAKSTKGKGGKAQEPVNAEEIVQDASEAIAEDVTEIVEDAEVLSDDAPVETSEPDDANEEASVDDIAESETPVEPEAPTPEVVRETVVERKGGFVPLVLGGVVVLEALDVLDLGHHRLIDLPA